MKKSGTITWKYLPPAVPTHGQKMTGCYDIPWHCHIKYGKEMYTDVYTAKDLQSKKSKVGGSMCHTQWKNQCIEFSMESHLHEDIW